MNDGTIKAIQEDVTRVLVARLRRGKAAVHDAEMAFKTELCTGRCNLASGVGLDDTAAYDHVCACVQGDSEIKFELADLVAAGPRPVQSSRLT
jgi:hypothetical protein